MNAVDQAQSLELAQAIASVLNLFQQAFPAAQPNLKPWRDDAQTRAYAETESVDLSFHFPGWSPRLQCRSLLVQMRLERAPTASGNGGSHGRRPRLLGVLIRGLTYDCERWRLATIGDWQPSGSHLPQRDVVEKLHHIAHQLFDLFGTANNNESDDQAA